MNLLFSDFAFALFTVSAIEYGALASNALVLPMMPCLAKSPLVMDSPSSLVPCLNPSKPLFAVKI